MSSKLSDFQIINLESHYSFPLWLLSLSVSNVSLSSKSVSILKKKIHIMILFFEHIKNLQCYKLTRRLIQQLMTPLLIMAPDCFWENGFWLCLSNHAERSSIYIETELRNVLVVKKVAPGGKKKLRGGRGIIFWKWGGKTYFTHPLFATLPPKMFPSHYKTFCHGTTNW